jgi:hypothetical protein
MTELRDARLKEALAHAPDAHMTPDARTRTAIRAMAGRAVAPSAPRPVGSVAAAWWRRLWHASGNSRGPWGAALATVVLVTLVTVLWRDEEIPGARTADAPMATAPAARSTQAPSVALPSTGAPAAAPTSAPAPAPAPAPKPAPAEKAAQPEPARALRPEESAAQTSAKKVEGEVRDKAAYVPAPAPVQQAPAQESQGAVVADAQPARREDERRRTAERSRSDNAVAPAAPPVGSSAAAPAPLATPVVPVAPGAAAPVPPPVALAVPARPVAPAAAGAAAARASVPAPDLSAFDVWTQARVSLDGRVSVITPGGHGVLVAQLRAVASQARAAGAMAGPLVARIELLRGDEVLGTLVVGEASVQWTVRRGGMDTSFSGVVAAAQVIELLEEVRRAR